MSYANGTQFYNLPQTVGTDKRDWFDTNSAFAAIDAALHSAVTGQATDAEAIATINGKLADDEADIAALQTKGNTHDSQIAALQTTVNTQASQIQDVRQDAEDMITANNEGAAATSTRAYEVGDYFIYNDVLYKATEAIAIGDTIVPNTNCEATNVDTELTQVNSDKANNPIIADIPFNEELNGTSYHNHCVKIGNVVFFEAEFTLSDNFTASTLLYTFPEGFKPGSGGVMINCITVSYPDKVPNITQLYIRENGTSTIGSNQTKGEFMICGNYVATH